MAMAAAPMMAGAAVTMAAIPEVVVVVAVVAKPPPLAPPLFPVAVVLVVVTVLAVLAAELADWAAADEAAADPPAELEAVALARASSADSAKVVVRLEAVTTTPPLDERALYAVPLDVASEPPAVMVVPPTEYPEVPMSTGTTTRLPPLPLPLPLPPVELAAPFPTMEE